MRHTTIQTADRISSRARAGWLWKLAPAVILGACQYYDFSDLLPGGGHHGGGHSGGAGGAAGGQICGGLLGLGCAEGEFCSFAPEAQCGAGDQTGTCAPKPEACTLQYDPVCGCDGQTYGNACGAASAGVSVVHDGECAPEGQLCGVRGAEPCADGEFCDFPVGSQCGAADEPGVCKPRPDICTEEYAPVCGCNGETYGNACSAAAAGVSVERQGECGGLTCRADFDCPIPPCACLDENEDGQCENTCPTPRCVAGQCVYSTNESLSEGDFCGGFTLPGAPTCGEGLFCQHQAGDHCGAADAPGVCTSVPDLCPAIFAPVCGCDGRTYGNSCEATRAQVGILERGECE